MTFLIVNVYPLFTVIEYLQRMHRRRNNEAIMQARVSDATVERLVDPLHKNVLNTNQSQEANFLRIM